MFFHNNYHWYIMMPWDAMSVFTLSYIMARLFWNGGARRTIFPGMTIIWPSWSIHHILALGKNWESEFKWVFVAKETKHERLPTISKLQRRQLQVGFQVLNPMNSTRFGPGHRGGRPNYRFTCSSPAPRPKLADPGGHKPVPADDAARASPCSMTNTV